MKQTHELKTQQPYYDDVLSGRKSFELRRDDRDFKLGDLLLLREFNPRYGFTGETQSFDIVYILRNSQFLKEGYCALGLAKPW